MSKVTNEFTANSIYIQGHLVKDAEVSDGRLKILLANNLPVKDEDGKYYSNPTFVNVEGYETALTNAAVEDVKKGMAVSIVGRLDQKRYLDENKKQKYGNLIIEAQFVTVLSEKSKVSKGKKTEKSDEKAAE